MVSSPCKEIRPFDKWSQSRMSGLGHQFPDKRCRLKPLWLMLSEPEKPDRPNNNVLNFTLGVATMSATSPIAKLKDKSGRRDGPCTYWELVG
jgi:hypothetical protein